MGGLAVPLGAGLQAKAASRLATRNMPVPYAAAFIRPPVLPYTALHDAEGPYRLYTVTEQRAMARIVNGLDTPVYAYNGSVPGPTIKVPQGTRVKLRVRNQLPALHPRSGTRSTPRPTFTARRRCRSTTGTPTT